MVGATVTQLSYLNGPSQQACKVVGQEGIILFLIRNWRCPKITCLPQGHILFGGQVPQSEGCSHSTSYHGLCSPTLLRTLLGRWEGGLRLQWELGKASEGLEDKVTPLPPLPSLVFAFGQTLWGG